jgi:hypothetical protein
MAEADPGAYNPAQSSGQGEGSGKHRSAGCFLIYFFAKTEFHLVPLSCPSLLEPIFP